MNANSLLECERKRMKNLEKLQLSNLWKKVGLVIAVASFVAIFINKFTIDVPAIGAVSKYALLIGMLLVSVSKDRIEDELIIKLRMQSYTLAFIFGVFFSIAQPFINYLVDILIKDEVAVLQDAGDFSILWMLLSVQVLYFEVLKRMHS